MEVMGWIARSVKRRAWLPISGGERGEGMVLRQRRSPIRWSSQMLWEKKSIPSPGFGREDEDGFRGEGGEDEVR